MKKALNFIFIIVFTFFFSLQVISAEEENSNVSWWVYDHTNFQEKEIVNDSTHQYVRFYNESFNNYVINNHIEILDNGKTIDFKGYGAQPITDFVYYPSDNKQTKTFSLSINKLLSESEQIVQGIPSIPGGYGLGLGHTFSGLSIFFNTKITGSYSDGSQILNGNAILFGIQKSYLIEFKDLNTKNLHDGIYYRELLNAFDTSNKNIIGNFNSIFLDSTKPYTKLKLTVSESSIKLYTYTSDTYYGDELTDDNLVEFTLWNGTTTKEVDLTSPSGSYGFGVGTHYSQHACGLKTNFKITDVSFPVKFDFSNPVEEEVTDKVKCTEEYAKENPLECCKEFPNLCDCSNEVYKAKAPELCQTVECVGFSETKAGELLQKVFNIIKYSVTVLIIVLGTIDFVKASSAQDEQKMKKAQKDFIIRLIIAVSLYFVVPLINLIFNLVGIGGTCGIK